MTNKVLDWRHLFLPIRHAKDDFEAEHNRSYLDPDAKTFIEWLDVNYGITLFLSDDFQHLEDRLEISDEKKYLLFMLKYST